MKRSSSLCAAWAKTLTLRSSNCCTARSRRSLLSMCSSTKMAHCQRPSFSNWLAKSTVSCASASGEQWR
ncbi:uncharacterized protein DMAD_09777 [Drosophila madeirensis]|uniref:Secreted protein n=1 Tax=Drosophila madeirensis TaxID=30013 RepID=A0AAU9F215_DROMD